MSQYTRLSDPFYPSNRLEAANKKWEEAAAVAPSFSTEEERSDALYHIRVATQ